MKKNIFSILAIVAITFFCSQFASAQWIICNNSAAGTEPYITAPYFSADLRVTSELDGYAEAGLYLKNRGINLICDYPGCSKSKNVGPIAGGISVYIYCYAEGPAYAKIEIWK